MSDVELAPEGESLSDSIKRVIKSLFAGNESAKDRDMAKSKSNAKEVPLGTGAVDKGRSKISGRQRQIDDAVKAAGG